METVTKLNSETKTVRTDSLATARAPHRGLLLGASLLLSALAANAVPLSVSSYAYLGGTLGFADTGGVELTDGAFAPNTSFNNAQFIGVRDDSPDDGTGQPIVLFDLGSANTVGYLVVSYLHSTTQAGGTITALDGAFVRTSLDGITYSSPIAFLASAFDSSAGDAVRQATLDITDVAARYVELDLRNSSQWTFIDEIQIHGTTGVTTASAPDTASTLPLLGLALGGMVWFSRRRLASVRFELLN